MHAGFCIEGPQGAQVEDVSLSEYCIEVHSLRCRSSGTLVWGCLAGLGYLDCQRSHVHFMLRDQPGAYKNKTLLLLEPVGE